MALPGILDGLRQFAETVTAGPVVQVRDGKLRGRQMTSRLGSPFLAFKGIPYAKPPLGDLRFWAPRPPDPWAGVRDATSEGPFCPQAFPTRAVRRPGANFGRTIPDFMLSTFNQPASKFAGFAKRLTGMFSSSNDTSLNMSMGEDCLWLDVFTPQTSLPAASLMPVLVNIHGGSLTVGGGTSAVYGPEYLMDRELVMVTLNYRLGVLGFLYSNTSDAPGNAGLKDQSQALRWVRDNIRAFGGDPDRVTLFGESAGSVSVHYHVLSPMSRGLFSAGIMSSTAALSALMMPTPRDSNLRRTVAMFGGPANGSPADMVRFLRNVPAIPLAGFMREVAIEQEDLRCLVPSLPFYAVVEPRDADEPPFFSEDFSDLVASGRHARVPLMAGHNLREGSLFFTMRSESDVARVARDPTLLVPDQLFLRLGEAGRRRAAQQIRDVYLGGQRASADTLPNIVDHWGDLAMVHGIDLAARWHSLRAPVFRYIFTANGYNVLSQFLAMPKSIKGPGHADDLGYIFYSRLLGDTQNAKQELFESTLNKMLTFVANFCYYRNPTPNVSERTPVLWPPFRAGERAYMDIGAELAVRRDLWPERMALWSRLHRQVVAHPVYDPPT